MQYWSTINFIGLIGDRTILVRS